jgi:hypothetical protein
MYMRGSGWRRRLAGVITVLLAGTVVFATATPLFGDEQPWVSVDAEGRLVYRTDPQGNRIPDFSHCGYGGGGVPLPTVANAATLTPAAGDRTAAIQAAIDRVSRATPDGAGLRGAVLLSRGTYHVAGTLHVAASGVVLRGEGQGEDGSVLVCEGKTKHNLIEVAGTGSRGYDSPAEATEITDDYVPVGATTFTVADASRLTVGRTVWVDRPATAAWLAAIGMDRLPPHRIAPDKDPEAVKPWDDTYHLRFDRIITAVNGHRVTVDAPLANAFEKRFGGGTVYPYHFEGRIEHVGVENLRMVSAFAGKATDDDERHGWIAVDLTRVQNAWIRDVTCLHFGFGLANIGRDAKWVTVQDCSCLDPVSIITGGRRYSYNIMGELSLVQRCYSREGRHDFALDSRVPGPNVFLDCRAERAHDDAGPHHRWSTGTLFDNVQTHVIDLQDRLNMGSGHGWAGANSVMWNCRVDQFRLQDPPTAHNWAIGTVGQQAEPSMTVGDEYRKRVPDDYFAAHPLPDPAWGFDGSNHGTVESPGLPVRPRSLYLAQLRERLGAK